MLSFPNDTKTATTVVDASGGTNCPVILTATTTDRTILSAQISGGVNNGAIKIDGNNYLVTSVNDFVSVEAPLVFNNKAVTCERANNKPFQFIVNYIDRDLSKTDTTVNVTSSTTITAMPPVNLSVENLIVTATTDFLPIILAFGIFLFIYTFKAIIKLFRSNDF